LQQLLSRFGVNPTILRAISGPQSCADSARRIVGFTLWFTENEGDRIGRITPTGQITEFPLPTGSGSPEGITAGPDGTLWFTKSYWNKIGRITFGK